MPKRNWKRHRATSLVGAFRDCKDFALDQHSRSVPRIAELSGQSEDSLYKWLANGRMPAILIPVFEMACGCSYVTEFLAASANRLVIAMPKGRTSTSADLVDLPASFAEALKLLSNFYAGKADEVSTQEALKVHLEQVAWHHSNVGKHANPELEFEA